MGVAGGGTEKCERERVRGEVVCKRVHAYLCLCLHMCG